MDEETMSVDQVKPCWSINLDWYEQNNRSFFALTQSYLCPKCRERLKIGKKEPSAAKLLSAIRDCCSKTPGFFAPKLPISERIFRLLLANGNQPLDIEELQKRLSEFNKEDAYRTSAETLSRLLGSDHHYGLCQKPPTNTLC